MHSTNTTCALNNRTKKTCYGYLTIDRDDESHLILEEWHQYRIADLIILILGPYHRVMSLGNLSRVKLIMLKNNCAKCFTCIIKCRMIKELFMKKVMSLVTILKHGHNIGISLSKSSNMKLIILNNKCPNAMLASLNVGCLQDIL